MASGLRGYQSSTRPGAEALALRSAADGRKTVPMNGGLCSVRKRSTLGIVDTKARADGDEAARRAMRGGLAWLDTECVERFGHPFLACTDAERRALLDLIAWPAKAPPELSHGVAFFSRVRDLTASGFWSSKMGIADLQYLGNTAVAEWTGCPPEALAKLGVKYD